MAGCSGPESGDSPIRIIIIEALPCRSSGGLLQIPAWFNIVCVFIFRPWEMTIPISFDACIMMRAPPRPDAQMHSRTALTRIRYHRPVVTLLACNSTVASSAERGCGGSLKAAQVTAPDPALKHTVVPAQVCCGSLAGPPSI